MQRLGPEPARGGRRAAARRWFRCGLLAVLLAAAGPGAGAALLKLQDAERVEPGGQTVAVRLPLTVSATPAPAAAGAPLARLHLRLALALGTAPHDLALYIPGLAAHARISVNGHVLEDRLDQSTSPLPRSVRRIRWLRLPDAALQAGRNTLDIEAAGTPLVALSEFWLGPSDAVEEAFDERVLAVVVGPALVSTITACLGLCVLVLWARRPRETIYGYFGIGALAWGLHTGWSVLPLQLLPGVHQAVWWTSLYAFFVAMLAIFCTRFAGGRWRAFDHAAWALALLAPLALYAGQALGHLGDVAEAWRAASIAIVGIALARVLMHAWRRRDATSGLLLAAGAAGFGLGARDWWVAHQGVDNHPVYLTPYAGLPFIALVAWMLVDGFVRASRELEDVNASLEARVARGSAELQRALDAMRAAKDEAEQADRAKSRFLAAASHDLRQPIHALGLYLDSLPVERLAEPVRGTLLRMGQSLTALQSMLEALLDISRMDAGVVVPQLRPFDLDALLHRLGDEFAPLAERKGLRLVLRGAPAGHGLQALSDPLLLERIVRNLLANAVQYTQHGGVMLSWRLRDAAGASPRWLVEVRDTGCGIEAADQERVFDEFHRLDNPAVRARQGLGLGLGLSIVRRLSRLLGLDLRLRSWPGRGTQMALTVEATRRLSQPTTQPDVGPLPMGRCVALVEDDELVLAAMRTLLAEWQCRCIDGLSGAQVLDRWRAAGQPRVDAIVADFRLQPGHTGLDVIAQLRAAFGDAPLPALVITGEAAPERLRTLTDSGLPWLSKPVSAMQLRHWLATAVERAAAPLQENPA